MAAALYNGSPDSSSPALTPSQRAALGILLVEGTSAFCTATLVRPDWVLSAAHCDVPADLVFQSSDRDIEPVRADYRVKHPELDVLLVHLSLEMPAVPIDLFDGSISDHLIDESVTLAGVGLTETGGTEELRFVEEPVVEVTEDEIAVDGMGQSGACVGDSGGPLLVPAAGGEPRVLGTLRRGEASCMGLDYYVRADRFAAWLLEEAGPQVTSRCQSMD